LTFQPSAGLRMQMALFRPDGARSVSAAARRWMQLGSHEPVSEPFKFRASGGHFWLASWPRSSALGAGATSITGRRSGWLAGGRAS